MKNIKIKNSIDNTFYNRYFLENAKSKLGIKIMKFMWFREGEFINPQNKNLYLDKFIKKEVNNFYNDNMFNIPQIEFCITTKCTLNCRDCNTLIPKFDKCSHFTSSLMDIKFSIDKLTNSVNKIRHFIVLGGEPLLHNHLPEIIEYACNKSNIDIVNIITNGTLMPSDKLLATLKRYNNKSYVLISNYSVNEDLLDKLKQDKIKNIFKENNIKFQLVKNWTWNKECGFAEEKFSHIESKIKFKDCYRTKCTQVLDSKINICAKAGTGRMLNLVNSNDYIDLKKTNDLRKELLAFYKKDCDEACEYCILSDEKVTPALQLKI